jgi:hypothetical protein
MTRASLRRAIPTVLLIGLPVASSCSAPPSNTPPRPGDGVTIVAQPTDGWDKPCSLPEGTQFTVSVDRDIGTRSSTAGENFTAHVSWPVATCERDVIAQGAILRGRVVAVERGEWPRISLAPLEVDTTHGPAVVTMVIRSVAGYAAEVEERPFRASVVYGRPAPLEPGPTGRGLDVEIPAGSELVIELGEAITVVP